MQPKILWPRAVIVHGPVREWGDVSKTRELERLAEYFGKTSITYLDLPTAFYADDGAFPDHDMVLTEDEAFALAHKMEHGAHVYTLTMARREAAQYGTRK